jgi:hypothetical protein
VKAGTTPTLDVVEIDLSDDLLNADGTLKSADLLNDDGTLKSPLTTVTDTDADTDSDAATAAATTTSARSFDLSPASIRTGYEAKLAFFRSHNYHHPTLSEWPGHWTTNQNIILAYRDMMIRVLSQQAAQTPRAQLMVRLFYKFKYFDLWYVMHNDHTSNAFTD